MPKFFDRRIDKAKELLERLERGPSFSDMAVEFTVKEAQEQFRLWCSTWIIPDVKELIPELKEKKR